MSFRRSDSKPKFERITLLRIDANTLSLQTKLTIKIQKDGRTHL